MLNSFVLSTAKQGKINPREFWALREFYSPGTISINKSATVSPFLTFKSGKVTSYESLIPAVGTESAILPIVPQGQQTDFRTKTELIYHNSTAMHIYFFKPLSDMVTANAVYDYKDKDKKFVEGKLWYAETTIDMR